MTLFALAFVIGVWGLQQLPQLPDLFWTGMLIPLLLMSFWQRYPSFHRLAVVLFALALGFFWAAIHAHVRMADALPHTWEGRDIQLVGVISSMPQQQERGIRFEFDVERVLTEGARVPAHVSLTWYADDAQSVESASRDFHAAQRWQLTVRLKHPHGTLNPHGFDFEAWALENNIRATGYIRKEAGNRMLYTFIVRPAYLVEAARENIRQRMQVALDGHRYGGILQALAVGDEAAIQQDEWQTFLRTGTNHLMSISGLHITMLAGLGYMFAYALWRRSERLVLRLPARKAATLAGAVIALSYALIAGFSVPAQRTFFMLSVIALALWAGRNVAVSRVLVLALLVVIVMDPWAVLAPGFWLSFSAVGIIAYVLGGRLKRPHWLKEAVHVQGAISLGLVPLLLILFNQVSIISPVANALAIPLVSLVVVPLTLAGSLLSLGWLLSLAHAVMATCMWLLEWMASWPVSTWQQHAPPVWAVLLAILGIFWILLPRGLPMRWLGLIVLMPIFLVRPAELSHGAMKVTVLDVGQGLAVVVRTAAHTLLYDTGPRYSTQSDSGGRIVVPFLRGEGAHSLDAMIVSHDDNDHAGGMASILEQMPVGWISSSLPESATATMAVEHRSCAAGQTWTWDGVQFDMLHPAVGSYDKAIKDNDRSCVLRISSPYGSLLLPGDIERKAEADLVGSESMASDVLVVPHHGSKTSSTSEFIREVQPKAALFTVGYRNRFGHPKEDVLGRYRQAGAEIYRSDHDGALLVDFSADAGIVIKRWRSEARRYWHDADYDDKGLLAEIEVAR